MTRNATTQVAPFAVRPQPLTAWVTDMFLLIAFLAFIFPAHRIGLGGIVEERGIPIGLPRISEVTALLAVAAAVVEWTLSVGRFRFGGLEVVALFYMITSYIFGTFLSPAVVPGTEWMRGNWRSGMLIPVTMLLIFSQLYVNETRLRRILKMFVLAQLFVSFVLVLQRLGYVKAYEQMVGFAVETRIWGYGTGATHVAYHQSIAIVAAVALAGGKGRGALTAMGLYFIAIPSFVTGVMLTMTRTTLVGIPAAFAAMFARRRRGWIVAISLLVFVIVVSAAGSSVLKVDLGRFQMGEIVGQRVIWWGDAARVAMKNPFGTGLTDYRNPKHNNGSPARNPQNDLLFTFATQGWLVGAIHVTFYVLAFRRVWACRRADPPESERWFRFFLAVAVLWMVWGLTEIPSATYSMHGPTLLTLALCSAYIRAKREQQAIQPVFSAAGALEPLPWSAR